MAESENGSAFCSLLIQTNLSSANITGAILSGTARDNWVIDDIKCEFIYLYYGDEGKRPKERDFYPGEFEELYRQLPALEYVFENEFTPIDAIIMNRVVQTINEKHPEYELRLDSFHSRGQPHAVFTVLHKDVAEVALSEIKDGYEERIKSLEGKRDQLLEVVSILAKKPNTIKYIAEEITMNSDIYKTQGQTGAVGPGAHAHDINFNQLWNQYSSKIDLKQLAEELSNLRDSLIQKADEPEHYRAIAEVSEAETSAKDSNGPKVLKHLKKAGKWAFSVAENIGTTIAAEALKKAMGL